MNYRQLGNTGWQVPLVSLGGGSILQSMDPNEQEDAIQLVKTFFNLGGNYIDTSPEYAKEGAHRTSESLIGTAIKDINRENIYLATKTEKRNQEEAWKDINMSVETLGTTLDCLQIHHLDYIDEVDQIFGKNGAMVSATRAVDEGLTKYLGITGHSDPKVLMEALSRFPFNTVLAAFNPADIHMKDASFQKELIPKCRREGIGLIAMKVFSKGALFRKTKSAEDILNYVWTFPVDTAIIGINNKHQLQRNFEIANNFQPLSIKKINDIEQLYSINPDKFMFFNKNGNEKEWDNWGDDTPTQAY